MALDIQASSMVLKVCSEEPGGGPFFQLHVFVRPGIQHMLQQFLYIDYTWIIFCIYQVKHLNINFTRSFLPFLMQLLEKLKQQVTNICGWHAISVNSKTNLRMQLCPNEPEIKERCKKCKTVLPFSLCFFVFVFGNSYFS